MTDEPVNPDTPTPFRLGRMNTARGYRRALHRLANAVLDGSVPARTAGTVGFLIGMAIKALEVEVNEGRLGVLEQQALEVLSQIDKERPRSRMVGHA